MSLVFYRGPAFLNLGIRGHIRLYEHVDNVKLEGIFVEQDLAKDHRSADLQIYAFLTAPEKSSDKAITRRFEVWLDGQVRAVVDDRDITCSSTTSLLKPALCKLPIASIRVHDVKLWWPRGYGDVHLYAMEVRMQISSPVRAIHGSVADDWQVIRKRIGIRRVELIQDPIPSNSSTGVAAASFYLKVNEVPIFVKGANFIPIDSFPSRITASDRAYILHAAAAANMNMIRVW
jgi:beta-galactosidase/beta-glucuronidase